MSESLKEDKKESHSEHRHYGIQTPGTAGVPGTKRYGMIIDLRKCIGCMSCVVADKTEYEVPLGVWRTWVKVSEKGEYPNVRKIFLPRICNHCDYPHCVRNCPTQATYKHKDGFVLQRYNRCIGCRTCIVACPYNARHFLPAKRTNMNLPHAVVDKCTFCVHRVKQGVSPACVQACVGGARIFGDFNDPNSEVAKLLATERVTVLKPEMGTNPQVYYIMADKDIMDEVHSYKHRSEQLKKDFNDFKRNHIGMQHGDLIEGESTTKQIFKNMGSFAEEMPHKFLEIGKALKRLVFNR